MLYQSKFVVNHAESIKNERKIYALFSAFFTPGKRCKKRRLQFNGTALPPLQTAEAARSLPIFNGFRPDKTCLKVIGHVGVSWRNKKE